MSARAFPEDFDPFDYSLLDVPTCLRVALPKEARVASRCGLEALLAFLARCKQGELIWR